MRSYDSLLQDAGGNLCDMHDIRYRLERLIDLARQDGATREWVDLTDDEIHAAIDEPTEDLEVMMWRVNYCRAVIAAFKEKNK